MDTNEKNLINLNDIDLNTPIYRIYTFKRMLALLSSRQDALVLPSKWEDPFESFFLQRTRVDNDGNFASLENLANDWHGQCWSFEKETDAMWRIYSPQVRKPRSRYYQPGVKVKSTIRKVFENLKLSGSQYPDMQFFVGAVRYKTETGIRNLMSHLTFSDLTIGGQGDAFAALLCVKRDSFRHEREVRILFQDIRPNRGVNGVFTFGLDAMAVFDELVLDPRLPDEEVIKLTKRLKNAGWKKEVTRSNLYAVPAFVIKP